MRSGASLKLMPVSLRVANAFVQAHHRHHRPVQGGKFSLAVTQAEASGLGQCIVGAVIVGRPVARHLDDGWTLEVTRLCTDGTAQELALQAILRAPDHQQGWHLLGMGMPLARA